MPLACFPLGPLQTNSYVLHQTDQAVVIDVGGDPAPMLAYFAENKLKLAAICITHIHFDHIYGVAKLAKETHAPIYCPKDDDPIADTEAAQGGIWGFPRVEPFTSSPIALGQTTFADLDCTVLATPGHTPGSVSLYFPNQNIVFSGDALFYRSVGRTDLPGGDSQTLINAIQEQLFTLPEQTRVLPGHGPEASIGDEKRNNPIVGEFTF